MPNTLSLIANRGVTFNRYYVSYPLCCPSRVSLLTGRYAHNHNVRGNVPPERRLPGLRLAGGVHPQHRRLAAERRLPHDPHRQVPQRLRRRTLRQRENGAAGLERLAHGARTPTPTTTTTATRSTTTGRSKAPTATRAAGKPANTACATTSAARSRRPTACPATTRPTSSTHSRPQELAATPPTSPSTCRSTTRPRTATSAARPAPSRRRATTTPSPAPPTRTAARRDSTRATSTTSPASSAKRPTSRPTEIHTYRVYYQKALESLRSVDDGVKQIVDALGALHRLRNTYIIFTSDNGFFFGEHRLTGGKFLAYEPSTHLPFLMRGPGIKPGTSTGELAANIDIAPTILELAQAKADKSIDGRSLVPFAHDPSLRTRRPILFESFVETNDVEENGGGPPATPRLNPAQPASRPALAPAAPAPRSSRRRRTTTGSASAPTSTSSGPTARKSSTTSTRTPTSSTTGSRNATSSRSAPSSTGNCERLETCVGKECQEVGAAVSADSRTQQRQAQREKRRQEQHKH